jgi:peptidyl-prolyl cis-trans isomerase C
MFRLILLAVTASALSAQNAAPAADPVVISVGDLKITRSQFDLFLEGLPEHIKAMASGPGKRNLGSQVVEVYQAAMAAKADKFESDPKIKAQLDFQAVQLLANTYLNQEVRKALEDEKALHDWYERNIALYQQVKARHILIRMRGSAVPLREGMKDLTEEEAKAKAEEIIARIKAGEDFAKLAQSESDDVGTGARGGDLGYFSAGQMVQPFEQAAFAMQPGELSAQPVKTQFGWHIIQVEARRARPFEDAKAEIQQKNVPETRLRLMDDIRKRFPATVDDEYFAK